MADKPVTREEKYLVYLTGDYKGELPKPITRKEKYLYELCLKRIGGEISPEEIRNAVNEYLEKNPVKPGATTEQAQQIEQNKTDIASLKEETDSLKEDNVNLTGRVETLEKGGTTGGGTGLSTEAIDKFEEMKEHLAFATTNGGSKWDELIAILRGSSVTTIPCTGITLNKTTLSFTDTTSQTLTATAEPIDTTDKVVWTSNNNTVVTVTNGVVKPLTNGSATITATCGIKSATCSVTVDIAEEEQVTLTSISATYTGGEVPVDTALTDLTGIAVTAHYSDGSTANVTGYTLSGTIAEGSNTITVTYEGKSATFTVTGVAESGGDDETTGTLLYSWDFTQGLTDSVGNVNAVLGGNATRDSVGVHINSATDYLDLTAIESNYKNGVDKITTLEIDFAEMEKSFSGSHGRCVMFGANDGSPGLIYRNTGNWAFYLGGWKSNTGIETITDANYFSGKTLKLVETFNDNIGTIEVYCDNTSIGTTDGVNYLYHLTNLLKIGSNGAQSFYNMTITGIRIYEEVA